MRPKFSVVLVAALAAALVAVPGPVAAGAAAPACGPTVRDAHPDTPWPLRRLRPDLVFPVTRGGGSLVAVIDSGVSPNHESLDGQVDGGVDFLAPGTAGQCDESGHGTIVAGIIAGRVTSSSGFHGIAPSARILPIRVLRDLGKTFDEEAPRRVAAAIREAVRRDADVINLSLTTPRTAELDAAVRFAVENDVVLVAAAGNEGATEQAGEPVYPAAYPEVIAVAGIDEQGGKVAESNPGDYVDVAAPGKNIVGPGPNGGGFGRFAEGGTSFAAAYVSGVVALVRAYRTDLNAEAVVRRVLRTADRPAGGWNPNVGFGVVNPYWAVTSIAGTADERERGGAVALGPPERDDLAWVRRAAAWLAAGGLVGVVLVLLAVPVVRRGRRRGWRPSRWGAS